MPNRRPRLLVVDDEPKMRSIIQKFAEAQDFEVLTHPGGRALLAELRTLKVDAALLDKNMPEVGGLDILRTIRDIDPECQVILMTGEATIDSAVEAVKL